MMIKILLVGLGFMGSNHLKNLQILEAEGKVQVVALVDQDAERLKNPSLPTYTDLTQAFLETKPDIVCIATSTKSHYQILKTLAELSSSTAILVEKPLTATSAQAEEIIPSLKNRVVSCGYLFRESPAVEEAIEYLRGHPISKIQTIWQKNRMEKGPPRPSEGVHIDEATHPIDLVMSDILPRLGYTEKVVLEKWSSKRESEVGISIVDRKMQEALYADEPSKLDPVAEVEALLRVGTIPIVTFSSFAKGPQRREIQITCTDGVRLVVRFDEKGKDWLETPIGVKSYPAGMKLLDEWRTFLHTYETGEKSPKSATLEDMLVDIQFTEKLAEH